MAEPKMDAQWFVAGCNGVPALAFSQQVLHLMAHFVQPLAGMNRLVTVPLGRDAGCNALLPHRCCHNPLLPIKVVATGKIPQQDISTSEVAPFPFAEVKPHRTPLLVAHHMELAGRSPTRSARLIQVPHPLVEAGRRAMGFAVRGIKHQHLFRLGPVGSCQLQEDQLESTVVQPAAETVVEGFVGSINRWGIQPGQAMGRTWMMPRNTHTTSLGEEGLDSLRLALSKPEQWASIPSPDALLGNPLSAEGITPSHYGS